MHYSNPLSVTASIIAVLGAIEGVTKTLAKIKNFRNAPQELLALINEISDLKLILSDVQNYVTQSTARPEVPQEPLQHMSILADRAKHRLLELDKLIQYRFTKADSTKEQIKVSQREWARARSTIETFRQSLRDIRLNIVTQMVVINSTHQSRIGLTIDEICIISGQLQANHDLSGERTMRQLDEHSTLLANILNSQSNLQGLLQLRSSSDEQAQVPLGSLVAGTSDQSSPIIRIRAHAFQPSRSLCTPQCGCTCHDIRSFRSPPFLQGTIGKLFIGYTGCPLGTLQRCTDTKCLSQSTFRAYVHYLFPSWLFAKAITITFMSVFVGKISVCLSVRRVLSPGAEIFRLIQMNDMDGLRTCFSLGIALPNDSYEDGRTTLSDAVQYRKLDCCKFLLQAGADPHLELFAGGRSPFEQAWDMIFLAPEGGSAYLETLRTLFPDNEGQLDERRFSKPHKIVLGLDGGSLEDELKKSSCDVDAVDSIGNTALMWAAHRSNGAAVNFLLSAGADPNIRSIRGISALVYVSRAPDPTYVKLLLKAGADPNIIDDNNQNALHHAAQLQDGKETVEALVAAGVDLEKKNKFGATALATTAYADNAVSANALIDLGADINSIDNERCTPLHESLFRNADDVTQILIRRGAAFKTNIYGDTNLHLAALSGGIRTLSILRAAPNLGTLDPDARNKAGKTPLQLARERVTKPERFIPKFQELLKEVKRQKATLDISFEAVNTSSGVASGPDATQEDLFVDAPEETHPEGDAAEPTTFRGYTRSSLAGSMLSCAGALKLLTPPIWTWRLWSNIQQKLAQSVWPRIFLSWLFGIICAGLVYWVFGSVGGEGKVRKGVSVIYLGGRDEA